MFLFPPCLGTFLLQEVVLVLVVAMAINMPVTQQAFWHHTHEMGFYLPCSLLAMLSFSSSSSLSAGWSQSYLVQSYLAEKNQNSHSVLLNQFKRLKVEEVSHKA